MPEAVYSLLWPKDIFLLEAKAILKDTKQDDLGSAITLLLKQAFSDPNVAETFLATFTSSRAWSTVMSSLVQERWLKDLIDDDSRLTPYEVPRYFGERIGAVERPGIAGSLTSALVTEIRLLAAEGYFPNVAYDSCTEDEDPTTDHEVAAAISRAVHSDVSWPLPSQGDGLTEEQVLSLVEFFYDNAQRPRIQFEHWHYGEPELHFQDHRVQPGRSLYTWRINGVLARHSSLYSLGTIGAEQGRLIEHSTTGVDQLANDLASDGASDRDEPVAAAIRKYRARGATRNDKLSALRDLGTVLEPLRKQFGLHTTTQAENTIFQLLNRFNIRHNNETQESNYGPEYMDWIFFTLLNAVALLRASNQVGPGA